jgi:transcriptional regulator with XRE-family HTH domain
MMVKLTAAQRQVFRDARRAARKDVSGVKSVSSSTLASIERGDGTHRLSTLCLLAYELGMDAETAGNAGLPEVARHLAKAQENKQKAAATTRPVSPAGLGDKLRSGMVARQENDSAARSLARDLRAGLSPGEQQALGKFLGDLASSVTLGDWW